jgi:predicted GNAT family acetyltransferase
MVLVQAPVELDAVVRAAVDASRRPVAGIAGPWTQATHAAAALGVNVRRGERELLYALDVAQLAFTLPPGIVARRPRADELDFLTDWREAYLLETRLAEPGPALRGMARAGIALAHTLASDWVLERDGALVAYTAFNARLPDIVQIGGVWTPVHLRRTGLARAAVASHVASVRPGGVRRAVLFTGESNVAARRAYEAIGFREVGDYGLITL